MSVLSRLLIGSGERLDLPDLLSIDSHTAADFKYLTRSFIGNDKPYVLSGFEVINPSNSIGSESVAIKVADSIVYYPGSKAGSFFYGLEEGNANAQPIVPELRKNATNFVYLVFNTFDTTKDSRSYWDSDSNGGAGGEFNQDVNTESILKIEANVSISTFPDNTIPICKVVVGANTIISIQDCRDMMFRLGSGGSSPNPNSDYTFRNDPNSTYARLETPTTTSDFIHPNPFQGGDKNIRSLKEWMDVTMTRIKEIGGTTYWYQGSGSSGPSIGGVFLDALGSTIKSKGEWQHSNTTPGLVTWTEDIHYYSLLDKRDLIFRSGSKTLANDEVAWIDLIRDADINTTSTAVQWYAGLNYVNGVTSSFENLSKGDWVKKSADSGSRFLRIEEFYALPALAGGTTTAVLAQSIRLSGTYSGVNGTELSQYTQGEFQPADVNITSRDSASIAAAGGNFFWLAYRSDTSLALSSATTTTLTIDITEADGERARVTSTAAHGLLDGDRVTVVAGPYIGTYQVEVEDSDDFFITTAVTGNSLGQTAHYAIITTSSRSTAYAYQIETANHGFQSNQYVVISGTASSFDNSYLINVRSTTSFQVPLAGAYVSLGAIAGEIVNLARVNVRTEFGTVKVIQGETTNIGDMDSKNILSYVGMKSLAETKPTYLVPTSYNTLNGHQNYNSDANDDLTVRVSKLTAMMADRVQDRGIQIVGRTNIINNAGSISALSNLTLKKPSSPDQTIDLSVPIAIGTNSVLVIDIDRDGSGTLTPTSVSWGSNMLISENKIPLFYRFSGSTVYTWRGEAIEPSGHLNTGINSEDSQNRNIFAFNPGQVKLNYISGLLTLDVKEAAESTEITTLTSASVPQSSYFTFNAANDTTEYYVWYNKNGGGVDPLIVGKTGIAVAISDPADNATAVAAATVLAINTAAGADVTASNVSDLISLVNDVVGDATDTDDGVTATTFAIDVVQQGFDPDIDIIISGSANNNKVDVDVINGLGTLVLADGQSAWIRVNRFAYKIFNTISLTNIPDTNIAGAIYITATTDVPIDQDVFVLWTRFGDNIAETNKAQRPDGNVYDETLSIGLPTPAGTIISLPLDSRDGGSVQEYIVGSGQLEIFLSGQYLRETIDWNSIGDAGALSKRIEMTLDLVAGDDLTFRIDAHGAVFFASDASGSGTSLQDAYDAGRFITTTAGAPIVIDGPAGKVVWIKQDLQVDGVIDPKGITFSQEASDPLDITHYGLWRNASDNLIYKRGVSTAIDLVNDFLRRDGTTPMLTNLNMNSFRINNLLDPSSAQDAATKYYVDDKARYSAEYAIGTNNTGATLLTGTIVVFSSTTSGEIEKANASTISGVEGVIGVVSSDILNTASGYVQISGLATVLGSPFTIGKRVYASSSIAGEGTSTPPIGTGKVVHEIGVAKSTTQIIIKPVFETVNENVYEEKILIVSGAPANDNEATGPLTAPTILTLPLDSYDSNSAQNYVVGKGTLSIYLNGQRLELGDDWTEVGSIGSNSSSVQIEQNLEISDELIFHIPLIGKAYFVSTSGGGSGTLQDAYDNGKTITVLSGQPIVIDGPAGKVMWIKQDLQVDGVIDPKALQLTPQASNPMSPGQAGIWVSAGNELMYEDGVTPAVDLSSVASGQISAVATKASLKNNTISTIVKLTPLRVNASGDAASIDVSVESEALSFTGIAVADILPAAYGDVAVCGVIQNISTSAVFGDLVYISKSGDITNVKPSIGIGGFLSGDFVVKVGIIARNVAVPANKDLVVMPQLIGQL